MPDARYCRPDLYRDRPQEEAVPELRPYAGSAAALERHQRTWLREGYLRDLRESFQRHVGPTFAGSVLEVGCGMGHLRRHLGLPSASYTGVDLNERFLAAGRAAAPQARFVRADASALPFASQAFDLVLCSDVLIHVEDMERALAEIVRVARGPVLLRLRSGNGGEQGKKVVYDPARGRLFLKVEVEGEWHHYLYNVLTPDELEGLLVGAGVRSYEVEDLLPPTDARMGLTKVYFDTRDA